MIKDNSEKNKDFYTHSAIPSIYKDTFKITITYIYGNSEIYHY